MHPNPLPPAPGCLVRLLGRFDDRNNRYGVTLWADGTLFSANWVSPRPPSLQALLENLAAFPFAWRRAADGQPAADEFLS